MQLSSINPDFQNTTQVPALPSQQFSTFMKNGGVATNSYCSPVVLPHRK